MLNRLALSEDQRDRLLTRLARRAKNVELAIDSISDEQPSSDHHLGRLQTLCGTRE
jgi:hypothetical protein